MKASPVVTIKELSFLSGYSTSTVSKALNNKLDVSKTARETIKTIAKQHNYIPNNYAVSLRARKSEAIAVILPKITEACYSHALCFLQKSAEKAGYRILFYQSGGSTVKELDCINSLNDGSIDGVIVISASKNQHINYSDTFSIPLVAMDIDHSKSPDDIRDLCQSGFKFLIQL